MFCYLRRIGRGGISALRETVFLFDLFVGGLGGLIIIRGQGKLNNKVMKNKAQFPTRFLPSEHQIGDKVLLNVHSLGIVTGGRILKVHFTEKGEQYDIGFSTPEASPDDFCLRLYNIESGYVMSAEYIPKPSSELHDPAAVALFDRIESEIEKLKADFPESSPQRLKAFIYLALETKIGSQV